MRLVLLLVLYLPQVVQSLAGHHMILFRRDMNKSAPSIITKKQKKRINVEKKHLMAM